MRADLELGRVHADRDAAGTCGHVVARQRTLVTLVELPRPGRFDVQVADSLGVPAGPERGKLQRGEITPNEIPTTKEH